MNLIENVTNISIINMKKRGRPQKHHLNDNIKVAKPLGRPKNKPLNDEEKLLKLYKLRLYWRTIKRNRKLKQINDIDECLINEKLTKDKLKLTTIKALNK